MEHLELVIKATKDLSPLEFLAIMQARVRVFVVEQNCAYQEADEKDVTARHVYLKADNQIVAYARITQEENSESIHFGRVLVVKEYRQRTLGKKIVAATLAEIKRIHPTKVVRISAQTYLQKMYESFGFQAVSDVYDEDGLAHVSMVLSEESDRSTFATSVENK